MFKTLSFAVAATLVIVSIAPAMASPLPESDIQSYRAPVVAALAAEAPNSRVSEDVALTKDTISLLAAKDFAAVRDRLIG
jgi:hypothetical protein